MHLVKVPENREMEMLTEFYNESMFTFEGINMDDRNNLYVLEQILLETGYKLKEDERVWYWFKGRCMNEHFALSDDNAYNDDLTFLVIPKYYNPLVKMKIGARWFDDICDNNARRQREIDYER